MRTSIVCLLFLSAISFKRDSHKNSEIKQMINWKFLSGNFEISRPAIANGVVYFGSWDNHLYAVNDNTRKGEMELYK